MPNTNETPIDSDNCDECATERATVLVVESTRAGIAAHMCRACAGKAVRLDSSLCTYGLID